MAPTVSRDLENFRSISRLTLGVLGANTPYSSSEPNKSVTENRQCGGEALKYVPKFGIGGTCHVISRMRRDNLHWSGILELNNNLKKQLEYTLGHNGTRIGNVVCGIEWSRDR